MTRPILMLKHSPTVPVGYLGDVLHTAGIPLERVDLSDGGTVPDGSDWAGVVSLGGIMGPYEDDRYPWLADERRLMAAAVDAGVPVLGLCLGCQVLADALGGRAYRAPVPEIGMLEIGLTDAGRSDPVMGNLEGAMPVWHGDTWDLPPGADLLAATDAYLHGFRLGSAVGIQAHPEATPYVVARWIATHEGDDFERSGVDPERFLDDVLAGAAAQEEMAGRLFGAWLGEVAARK